MKGVPFVEYKKLHIAMGFFILDSERRKAK
jgi:hypothetical protein